MPTCCFIVRIQAIHDILNIQTASETSSLAIFGNLNLLELGHPDLNTVLNGCQGIGTTVALVHRHEWLLDIVCIANCKSDVLGGGRFNDDHDSWAVVYIPSGGCISEIGIVAK
jgi:hypothetical protein